MSNGFEIAGSCVTLFGTVWLSIDAFLIRRHIRSEAGASKLLEILKNSGAGKVLTDTKGKPLDSEEALHLWFATRTIAWNWIALSVIAGGFVLDLIGKLRP
jgi:hypothetical protein